jgi:hypothetical protein
MNDARAPHALTLCQAVPATLELALRRHAALLARRELARNYCDKLRKRERHMMEARAAAAGSAPHRVASSEIVSFEGPGATCLLASD